MGEKADGIQSVLKRLESSKRIVAFTGAGISKESGIPTFRDTGGLWEQYRIEDVATPQAFRRDPKFVWNFYLERRKGALKAEPNAAHRAFADWEKGGRFEFVGIVTQNIDGLHTKAGSTCLQELHGNLWKARCTGCGGVEEDHRLEMQDLPRCRHCGGLIRPHIVWFGEPLDPEVFEVATDWMREADLIFVVGTSGVVEPAASLVRDAQRHGAFIVEVNPEETALTTMAGLSLFGRAAEIFGEWLKE